MEPAGMESEPELEKLKFSIDVSPRLMVFGTKFPPVIPGSAS